MRHAIRFVALVAALGAGTHAGAAGQDTGLSPGRPPCATCLMVVLPPGQIGLLPPALNGLAILVEMEQPGPDLPALLATIAARGGHPGVVLPGLPPDADLASLARASTIVLDVSGSTLPLDTLVYQLRTGLTALRATAQRPPTIAVAPPAAFQLALQAQTAGYWDVLISPDGAAGGAQWTRGGTVVDAGRALAATSVMRGERQLVRAPPGDEESRQVLADLAAAARVLVEGLVPADANLRVGCAGSLATAAIYLNPASLDRVAVLEKCGTASAITVDPASPIERVQLSSGEAIVRIARSADDRFAADVEVAATRRLTVEEVVARHQAAAARQAASVQTLISDGTLTVTFEAPGFPAPVTVSSRTTIFRDRERTDLEQREIRVNGLAFRETSTPRLPIIEPERVAAAPLVITLGDRYRYRLVGEATVRGIRAYVVAFDPGSDREPLFRGRAWIAADDFGLVRVEATETGLRGPVVSSEQIDDLARTPGGAWLLARSDIRQLYQGAGYRTPIHRVLVLASHDVNAADFALRRNAAYQSPHTMLRDTPAGYRYLERESRQVAPAGAVAAQPDVPAATGSAGRAASRVRTLAFGVIIDPNITRPLPFAGLSYLDFNLLGTGTQLNAFFGGTYGQLAFSMPSIGGTRWQLAGQAFGIASSYNNRAFVAGRELYEQAVRQRPASAAVWLMRPLTARLALRVGYDLDYNHFSRNDATAPEFVAPADQIASGIRVALDGQRAGWDGTVWWSGSRRAGWRAWGRPDAGGYRRSHRDFQRYGASIARSVIFSPRLVARGEGAIMAGADLDRFSQYSFGTFENRLRGYPSALIRYDRGAVLRGALAWSAGRLFRLDGFGDTAFVRDAGFARGVSRFTGIGAAIEAPAPFGTLVAAEWGYGIQGVNADGRRGTNVVRVTGYKVF